jgi:hypothetical protein
MQMLKGIRSVFGFSFNLPKGTQVGRFDNVLVNDRVEVHGRRIADRLELVAHGWTELYGIGGVVERNAKNARLSYE